MSRLTERPVKNLTFLAILTAMALVLNIAENSIPFFAAIPSGKLGLANIVTMFTFVAMDASSALLVGGLRCVLGGLAAGAPSSILYGAAGTVLSVAGMAILRRLAGTHVSEIGLSVAGAACYNIGQVAVACVVLGTPAALAYLPALTLIGAFAGVLTGAAAQLVTHTLKRDR